MNESELAKLALEMLKRVDLKGSEVPAYVEVNNWLNSKVHPGPVATAVPDATGMENPAVPPETQQ